MLTLDQAEAEADALENMADEAPTEAQEDAITPAGWSTGDAASLRQVMQQGNVTAYLHGHHAAYYPGRLAGLNVLSSGGIGGRDYVGFPGTARSVVTVLDVGQDSIQLTAYDADTGKVIPSASLPARIDGLNGPLTRITELR